MVAKLQGASRTTCFAGKEPIPVPFLSEVLALEILLPKRLKLQCYSRSPEFVFSVPKLLLHNSSS